MALGKYKSTGVKKAATIESLSVEELRGKVKITAKAQEDGTFTVKVTLGVLPIPTYEGATKFEGVPAEDVDAETAELTRDINSGLFDASLRDVQAKLVASGVKAKASREAKKVAKATAPEGVETAEAVAGL